MRGSFTDDWAAKPEYELKCVGGSAYATVGAGPAGAQKFKIADFEWKAATNCGAATDGVQVRLATPLSIVCRDGSKDLNFTPPAAGNYVFALDAVNVASPMLTVGAAPPTPKTLYVRGGFNDWAGTAPMVISGGAISANSIVRNMGHLRNTIIRALYLQFRATPSQTSSHYREITYVKCHQRG